MTNVDEELGDETTALKASLEVNDADGDSVTKDPTAVRFVNGNDKFEDVVVDVKLKDEEPGKNEDFVGLKRDELEKFASDPYWVRLRIILLVLFGIAWVAMLVAAIVIVVVAPKCPPRPDQDWWETAVVYQLNPNSFLDTRGSGKGDIEGIRKKLDYLGETLKVTALNIGPMYPSPVKNFGYDVLDFKQICRHFGTMEDFDSLRVSMHKRDMKLILDFIPNHTSRRHQWFLKSQNASLDNKDFSAFKDFYIWHNGSVNSNGSKQPPNDWLNAYGEPAWTLDEVRGEYYYHSYSKDEPDLDLNNPSVLQMIDDALLFWLGKNVDGFRLIGADHLVEPKDFANERNTEVLPETYKVIEHWRQLLDNYSSSPTLPKSRRFPRLLIADVKRNVNETTRFLGHQDSPGAQLPTNKALQGLKAGCDVNCVYSLVKEWSEVIESNSKIANWQVGNHETSRLATRMGGQSYTNAINLLLLTLPGTIFIYNGDELGMKDATFDPNLNYSLPQALWSRAGQHSPMQWSDKPNAGFTSGTPWIPVADDYHTTNVETQTAHGSGMSHIKVFKSIAALKQEPSFQWGKFYVAVDKSILFYIRQAEGFAGYLVAINFGPQTSTANFKESAIKEFIPEEAEIVASTYNFEGTGRSENFEDKSVVKLGSVVYLKPTEGIVLKWEPKTSLW